MPRALKCAARKKSSSSDATTREAIHSHLEVLITLRYLYVYKLLSTGSSSSSSKRAKKSRHRDDGGIDAASLSYGGASAFFRSPSPSSSPIGALPPLLGTAGTRRRKFIKYLKVRKRLLSPGAINFHLHFIFVSQPCSCSLSVSAHFSTLRETKERAWKNSKMDVYGIQRRRSKYYQLKISSRNFASNTQYSFL